MGYREEKDIQNRQRVEELYKELPEFCQRYFKAREQRLTSYTMLSYAYNMTTFFHFLHTNHYFGGIEIREYTLSELETLTTDDITDFTHWLRYSTTDNGIRINKDTTIDHYISTLSSMFNFFIKAKVIEFNPVAAVEHSPKKKKEVFILEGEEKDKLISSAVSGVGLTKKQLEYHEKNGLRDATIIKLFLDTGIRISELVGININDINFEKHCIHITRKGNKKTQNIYIGDVAEDMIRDYLQERHENTAIYNDTALFLNRDGERISTRMVQKLIKKYVKAAIPERADEISPHKLRSTYASEMLEYADVKVVADMLGHNNLNTTQNYLKVDESRYEELRGVLDKG